MPSIAVLVDVDNIAADFSTAILQKASSWGEVTIVRLFGDFTGNRHADWCKLALAAGYETILQLNGGRGKNSTDIALTISAMDLLHAEAADSICLVSNDRDFVPLAARIRAAGKRAYAICLSVDERTRGACSETFALAPVKIPSAKVPALVRPPIVEAFLAVSGGKREMPLADVASLLRQYAPDLFEGAPKNGATRKIMKRSGYFDLMGTGQETRARLKVPA